MGFDLTGYEKDNSIQMQSFAVYSFFGVVILIAVVLGMYFYLFMMGEKALTIDFLYFFG